MLATGMKCIKYLLFVFNLIFILAGIGLMAVGAYVWVGISKVVGLSISGASGPAILLIVVGAIVFIIAFFGCCGAIKENYCMVITFSVMLGIIFILEISAGIAAYVFAGRAADAIEQTPGFNETQCCDALEKIGAPCDPQDKHNNQWDDHACENAFLKYAKSYIFIVGGVGIVFALVQIFGIVFACCLARAIRNDYEVS